jgi:hypothetical protein
MKDIKDFLFERYYKTPIYHQYLEEYNLLDDLFNNEIPEEYLEIIKKGQFNDFILENLNTHDVNKLKDKINKEFKDKYEFKFEDYLDNIQSDKKSFLMISKDIQEISNDNEFNNLIEFYGYYISSVDKEHNVIFICPKYSEYANDLVYNKNHGILYHFTTLNKEQSILSKGLEVKEGNSYRKFPQRIYCYSEFKNLKNVKDIKKFIYKVVGELNIRRYGLLVLKIDLSKHNVCFYNDDSMEEKNSVFTYTSIPKELIEKININMDDLN